MTASFQESSLAVDMSLSFGFEVPGRPRAATVSFRYNVPQSPIYKPSVSPPQSPPSLILPPVGLRSGGLSRSSSRLSSLDERMASSAPSTSNILFSDSDDADLSRVDHSRAVLNELSERAERCSEFTLLEEEDSDYDDGNCFYQLAPNSNHMQFAYGAAGFEKARSSESSIDVDLNSFSASPILISCLRDIAKTRRAD